MLLEYLAFTFIRDIISLIRKPEEDKPEEKHVALDTILILCAALRSITTSVELKKYKRQFKPEVAIDATCYDDITKDLFKTFVPTDPNSINENFCSENGIYDRESYFRKLIPLERLDNALNKHSGLLWAYDYFSDYAPDVRLQTKNLGQIFALHCRSNRGDTPDYEQVEQNLGVTFESVDVLCIAKMIREKQTQPKIYSENYSGWLQGLCESKLKVFLEQNKCNDIFCQFVRFDSEHTLGHRHNRLRDYLSGVLFPARTLCQEAMAQGSSDSSRLTSSQESFGDMHPPITVSVPNNANPQQFIADLNSAVECSQSLVEDEPKDRRYDPVDQRPLSNSRNGTPPREVQKRERSSSFVPRYMDPTVASSSKVRERFGKGGNTKRTKRYKRKSNRRNKKNTRYSLRNTIKHRKTRRRN